VPGAGEPESPAAGRAPVADVEAFGADTGYPQTRFDAGNPLRPSYCPGG